MTAIFLDIDGVLNNLYTTVTIPGRKIIGVEDAMLERLRKIWDLSAETVIVLTSTGKEAWEPEQGYGGTVHGEDGVYLDELAMAWSCTCYHPGHAEHKDDPAAWNQGCESGSPLPFIHPKEPMSKLPLRKMLPPLSFVTPSSTTPSPAPRSELASVTMLA